MTEHMSAEHFTPDWALHPGEHVEDHLEEMGIKQAMLARLTGLTPKLVSDIVNRKNRVSPDTAVKLERVLGLSAEVWLALQSKWDLHQARITEQKQVAASQELLANYPLKHLKKRGLLPNTRDKAALAEGLCKLFGIGDLSLFSARTTSMAVHHRQSKKGEVVQEHIYTWLVLGERAASELDLPEYNADKFECAVKKIRDLTTESPEVFEPRMRHLCQEAGVALVFEKPIEKTKLFGSARWINGNRNALIQMSLRLKSNDHLWWTFFHECGHILLHRGKNFADDQNGEGDGLESEADSFAETVLYGEGNLKNILADPPLSAHSIVRLASELGLHPGIIVGMLQHYRVISFASVLNKLKARYEWTS